VSFTYQCPCGYFYEGDDIDHMNHIPEEGSCCNCGGRKCMACVFREQHGACEDDCPDCCPVVLPDWYDDE
jgi:hypothetical protein